MRMIPFIVIAALSLVLSLEESNANPSPLSSRLPVIKEFPDPFLMHSGKRVTTMRDWNARRKEIISLILEYEYGHMPPPPRNLTYQLSSTESELDGKATRRKYLLEFGINHACKLHLEMLVPNGEGPFPVILTGDGCWGEAPLQNEIIQRGYILAQFDRTEIAPDSPRRDIGVYPLYPGYDWGSLAAWAWGYSRAVDFLEKLPIVDKSRIAITGHSRGGKTVLLAGALDTRIAVTNPNDSGCGGAGSFRFQGEGSETLASICKVFPFWFGPNLQRFTTEVDRLPFDQHFLTSLVAPRALLLTDALGDAWGNPSGTQLVYLATKETYRFLGASDRLGSWYRPGEHAHNAQDWEALLDFADIQFYHKSHPDDFSGHVFPDEPTAFTWRAP
jgi:hypothetical protein